MNIPQIYIIGSMKCGTSALYEYLCTHPKVYPGTKKEVHYFTLFPYKGVEWYSKHFGKTVDTNIYVDASPTYFDMCQNLTIPNQIKYIRPNAKALLIFRDPVERAISHFQHLKTINKIKNLQAIDVNEFFKRDFLNSFKHLDEWDYLLSLTLQFSTYSRKYKYFKQVFQDDLLVIHNKELKCNTTNIMHTVFEFLDLEYHYHPIMKEIRYSNNSKDLKINLDIKDKLADYLYPSYTKFLCNINNV